MYINIINNVLNPERLAAATRLLNEGLWVDGHLSGGNDTNKHNTEMTPESPMYMELLRVVEASLREDRTFQVTAWPRYMTRPIISQYKEGMYYDEHTDFPVANFLHSASSPSGKANHRGLAPLGTNYVRTDLSITLFLSDPDSYGGGELCFNLLGEEKKYKLPAGSAVVYPTGVPHSVANVTRGTRRAAIFWVQSMFPNETQRRAVCEAFDLYSAIEKALPSTKVAQMAEVNFHNMMRMFASV